jgi:circadian clock protein KaiB
MTPRSSRAIANASALCETHLRGRFDLEVIDLYQQPERIPRDQIIMPSPMLVRVLPLPVRRIFGDLGNTEATLSALDVERPR